MRSEWAPRSVGPLTADHGAGPALRPTRVTVVYSEQPYPADHGGKAEVWGRLEGLHRLGVPVLLVCWSDVPPAAEALDRMRDVCEDVVVLAPRSLFHGLLEWRYPPRTRRLVPSPRRMQMVLGRMRDFGTELILLDNWPSATFAFRARDALRVPLVYRSQNVEVDYWGTMVRGAHGLRRLRLSVNARRIGAFERALRLGADLVLDISEEDRARSSRLGQEGRAVVLPGTRLPRAVPSVAWADRDIDVLFAGNLWAPNNVNGIEWFFSRVMPALRSIDPALRIAFAGSRPTAQVRALCQGAGVQCIADADDLDRVRARARVLMNPQLQYGGLMQKMLDYLGHDAWIVSTRVGAAGLTGSLPSALLLRDEPEAFAAELVARAQDPRAPGSGGAEYLEREFGLERLRSSVREIVRLCGIGTGPGGTP